MYVYFVGVTEYSTDTMALLNLYNYLMLTMMVSHLILIDLFIYMTFANIPLISLIIEGEIDDLQTALERKLLSAQIIRSKLRNITELCEKKNEWVE